MRLLASAASGALVALAGLPAVASAAQITTDRECYLDRRAVTLSGTGFTPGAPYQVTLDGQPITGGTSRVDPAGGVTGTFVPRLSDQGAKVRQHQYTLAVQEGSNTATSKFTVTKFLADFAPSSGNPRSLRVRFSVFGFGLGAANPDVYLHYVRPRGKLRKTIRLGRAKGACGAIERTARKRLFPFQAERGTWKLQFDTSPRYRAGKPSSDFLFYTVGVRIRPLTGTVSAPRAAAAGAGADEQRRALDAAVERWKRQRLRDYTYRLRVSCFCPDSGKPITVVVRDGRPRGATGFAKTLGTVPRLFREIRRALSDPKAGEVTATYDSRRGFPRVAAIDRIRLAIDDEIAWGVDRFRPLRRRR